MREKKKNSGSMTIFYIYFIIVMSEEGDSSRGQKQRPFG